MKSVSFALTTLRIMALGFVLAVMMGLGTAHVASSPHSTTPVVAIGQQVADSNGQETHGKNPGTGTGKRSLS